MRIITAAVQYKAVDWHGLTLHIPHDHVAVAADSNGWVYSYGGVPVPLTNNQWALIDSNGYFDICQVDLEGTDWRTTLVEYPL